MGRSLHNCTRRKYAPNKEMRLISNDIPQIGSALQFDKNDRFWKKTSALNSE